MQNFAVQHSMATFNFVRKGNIRIKELQPTLRRIAKSFNNVLSFLYACVGTQFVRNEGHLNNLLKLFKQIKTRKFPSCYQHFHNPWYLPDNIVVPLYIKKRRSKQSQYASRRKQVHNIFYQFLSDPKGCRLIEIQKSDISNLPASSGFFCFSSLNPTKEKGIMATRNIKLIKKQRLNEQIQIEKGFA